MREHTVGKQFTDIQSDDKERCIRLAEFLIEQKSTVRATAKHFGISKSTVHKDLSEKLPRVSASLYREAKRVLQNNKAERHLRGGQATKMKYRMLRNKKADKLPTKLYAATAKERQK